MIYLVHEGKRCDGIRGVTRAVCRKGRHRKNIRKVLDDDELEEKQKELLAREKVTSVAAFPEGTNLSSDCMLKVDRNKPHA